MTPSEMRAAVLARDGYRCSWPGCDYQLTQVNPLECAHLVHRQMGGGEDRNHPDNGVMLCKLHHDVFDGRQGAGKTQTEIRRMLAAVAGIRLEAM